MIKFSSRVRISIVPAIFVISLVSLLCSMSAIDPFQAAEDLPVLLLFCTIKTGGKGFPVDFPQVLKGKEGTEDVIYPVIHDMSPESQGPDLNRSVVDLQSTA